MTKDEFAFLVDKFDAAAQDWGWQSDMGYDGASIRRAMDTHDDRKKALLAAYDAIRSTAFAGEGR